MTEFTALTFLREAGVGNVPLPVAQRQDDDLAGGDLAIYTWIDGEPLAQLDSSTLEQLLAFARRLHGLTGLGRQRALAPAKEACQSPGALWSQIQQRLLALGAVQDAALQRFLEQRVVPCLAQIRSKAQGMLNWDAPLSPEWCTLSCSDFGAHNALRDANGTLWILDFEYFGWDDPAKLVSDTLWHPAMRMSLEQKMFWTQQAALIYQRDPGFLSRLRHLFPLFGVKWCLIILNEFISQHWQRRVRAGRFQPREWPDVKAQQLATARKLLIQVGEALDQFPYFA